VENLELYNKMNLRHDCKRKLKERLGIYLKDTNGIDLLDKLLTLDPKKRIDSDEALDHDFFWTDPLPSDIKLDKINQSMFEYTAQSYKRAQYRHTNKSIINDQHYDRVY
jgi:cyclin-dependent kinase 9